MSASPAKVSSGLMKQTTAETRNSTAKIADTQRIAPSDDARERDRLDAREREHQPDEHADRRDRRLVELQDHDRDGDPGDPGDEPQPPVAGDVARRRAEASLHRRPSELGSLRLVHS